MNYYTNADMRGIDKYGIYYTQGKILDGVISIEYRVYYNTERVKKAGGIHCLFCEESGTQKFFKTERKAMNELKNF